jgi:hypothetical protein
VDLIASELSVAVSSAERGIASDFSSSGSFSSQSSRDVLCRKVWRLLNNENRDDDDDPLILPDSNSKPGSKLASKQARSGAINDAINEDGVDDSAVALSRHQTLTGQSRPPRSHNHHHHQHDSGHYMTSTATEAYGRTGNNRGSSDTTVEDKENKPHSRSLINSSNTPRSLILSGGKSTSALEVSNKPPTLLSTSALVDAAKSMQTRRSNAAATAAATMAKDSSDKASDDCEITFNGGASMSSTYRAINNSGGTGSASGGGIAACPRKPLTPLPVGFAAQIREQQLKLTKTASSHIIHGGSGSGSITISSNGNGSSAHNGDADHLDPSSARAARWMRPKGQSPEKQDLQSVLEKRLGEMR